MKHPALFKDDELETSRSTRARHAAQVREWTDRYGIWTSGGGNLPDWMALSMVECVKALEGFSLTEAQRTDGFSLLCSYCRLLDDRGLIEYGHPTKYAACEALVRRIEKDTLSRGEHPLTTAQPESVSLGGRRTTGSGSEMPADVDGARGI